VTALTEDSERPLCTSPRVKYFPARADVVFFKGSIVCKRKDSKLAEIPDASTPRTDLIPLGVAICALDMTGESNGAYTIAVDSGLRPDFDTGTGANEITADHVGQTWYMYDDNTAYLTDNGGTLSPGGTIGLTFVAENDSTVKPALYFDCETPQALGEISEIRQSLETSLGHIDLAPSDFYLLTGAPLAIFANGASAVPGSAIVDSKAFGIRWNNNATLDAVMASFAMPEDCDTAFDMVVHVRASKTGATLADAVTFAVGAFNQVDGALHDADSNFGGNTSAMTGDAAAKTIQDETVTLAAANLAAAPASVTLTLKPTDGTLGTDDLVVFGVRVYYTKKLVAAS
jgi:hypothetical protein